MPCYDERNSPSYRDEQAEGRLSKITQRAMKLEAMLCAILTVLTRDQILRNVLRNADWKEAGVSQDEISNWWKNHQEHDKKRRGK